MMTRQVKGDNRFPVISVSGKSWGLKKNWFSLQQDCKGLNGDPKRPPQETHSFRVILNALCIVVWKIYFRETIANTIRSLDLCSLKGNRKQTNNIMQMIDYENSHLELRRKQDTGMMGGSSGDCIMLGKESSC